MDGSESTNEMTTILLASMSNDRWNDSVVEIIIALKADGNDVYIDKSI